jgi:leucyl-tRNA synthetase
VIQVNGRTRERIMVPKAITVEEAVRRAQELPNVQNFLQGKKIGRTVFVPDRLLNLVVQ